MLHINVNLVREQNCFAKQIRLAVIVSNIQYLQIRYLNSWFIQQIYSVICPKLCLLIYFLLSQGPQQKAPAERGNMDAESQAGSAWSEEPESPRFKYWQRPAYHIDYYAPYGWRSTAHTHPSYKWFHWSESFSVGSRVQHKETGKRGTVTYMSIFINDIVVEALLTYLHRWQSIGNG